MSILLVNLRILTFLKAGAIEEEKGALGWLLCSMVVSGESQIEVSSGASSHHGYQPQRSPLSPLARAPSFVEEALCEMPLAAD